MLSLTSTLARRVGMLGVTKRAVPLALKKTMYTRPKESSDETKIDFRYGFYGDENPEMREFFDSMEEKIEEIFNPEITPHEQKSLLAQARRTYAVDSPDGTSDGTVADEIQEIHKILDQAVSRKREIHARIDNLTEIMRARVAAAYAVDSPDGEDDGHIQEELQEVDRIIRDSALHEEKPLSDADKEMRKKRASDPEHW